MKRAQLNAIWYYERQKEIESGVRIKAPGNRNYTIPRPLSQLYSVFGVDSKNRVKTIYCSNRTAAKRHKRLLESLGYYSYYTEVPNEIWDTIDRTEVFGH